MTQLGALEGTVRRLGWINGAMLCFDMAIDAFQHFRLVATHVARKQFLVKVGGMGLFDVPT